MWVYVYVYVRASVSTHKVHDFVTWCNVCNVINAVFIIQTQVLFFKDELDRPSETH